MAFLELLMQIRHPVLDYLFLGISNIGNPVILIGLIAWVYINVDKNKGCGMAFAMFLTGCLSQGAKLIFRIPRPWILESDTSVFAPVPMALSTATGYSFPSVHMQATTAFTEAAFLYTRKKRIRFLSVAFLLLLAFSRMYLGVHTPTDILGAFAMTAFFTAVTVFGWNKAYKTHRSDEVFVFITFGFAAVLLFLGISLVLNGTVEFALAKDSYKIAGASLGYAAAFLLERFSVRFSTEGTPLVKFVRFLILLAGFLLLNTVTKPFLDTTPAGVVIRYILIVFWMFGFGPWCCMKTGLLKKASRL
ncbi:MAG: phosphatase PAP2 family protein [Lachnospiraceae bacterium]|nr:phosphatase PAP2 family protein [Lachnospiraceae bacterium]